MCRERAAIPSPGRQRYITGSDAQPHNTSSITPVSDPTIWGTHALSDGSSNRFSVQDLALELSSKDGEVWWRAAQHGDLEEQPWTRWVSGIRQVEVDILPCLPDRPVVVEPEVPFHIAPRGRADVFVLIPVWARIVSTKGRDVIAEAPLEIPVETWWGEQTAGEPAYAILTRARRVAAIDPDESQYAVCSMEFVNESEETLPVTQFAVRCPQLSLFQADSGLWTNAMRATFSADNEGSQIDILKRPPDLATGVSLVTSPRTPASGRWRALTFSRLVGSRSG